MTEKVGRNDPCPCGSGKKYKSCCWAKKSKPRKITAKWINAPEEKGPPDLMERTFGAAIAAASEKPPAIPQPKVEEKKEEEKPDTEKS